MFCSFEFRLRVSLAAEGYLTLISRIRNINCKPFSFSFAYHPYFSISDIRYRMFKLQMEFAILIIKHNLWKPATAMVLVIAFSPFPLK